MSNNSFAIMSASLFVSNILVLLVLVIALGELAAAEGVTSTCWCKCSNGTESHYALTGQCGSSCDSGCKTRCDPDNMDTKYDTTCSQAFDCTKFAAVAGMIDCVTAESTKCAKDPVNMDLRGNALACACNFVYWGCAKKSECTLQKGFHDACESTCLAKQCMNEGEMSSASASTTTAQAGSFASASTPGGVVIGALVVLVNIFH